MKKQTTKTSSLWQIVSYGSVSMCSSFGSKHIFRYGLTLVELSADYDWVSKHEVGFIE